MASFSKDRAARLLLTATELQGPMLVTDFDEPEPEVDETQALVRADLAADRSPPSDPSEPRPERRRRRRKKKRSDRDVPRDPDRVEVSPYTQIFNQALQAVEDSPDVRSQLVERMHGLLVRGYIATDVVKLADRLIDHLETSSAAMLAAGARLSRAKTLPP